jgi:hypothetical protein
VSRRPPGNNAAAKLASGAIQELRRRPGKGTAARRVLTNT